MASKWFREVLDDPGSVRNGPRSVRNSFGHMWQVSEGSRRLLMHVTCVHDLHSLLGHIP
jgi:hypothetical protein